MRSFIYNTIWLLIATSIIVATITLLQDLNQSTSETNKNLVNQITLQTNPQQETINQKEVEEIIQNINTQPTPTTETTQPATEPITNVTEKKLPSDKQQIYDELTKLKEQKVYLKKGSRGSNVATIQKFLNLYPGKKITVDGDFGPSTVNRVKEFQSDMKIYADGVVGNQFYTKALEWLFETFAI